jgi:hypothetical protein
MFHFYPTLSYAESPKSGDEDTAYSGDCPVLLGRGRSKLLYPESSRGRLFADSRSAVLIFSSDPGFLSSVWTGSTIGRGISAGLTFTGSSGVGPPATAAASVAPSAELEGEILPDDGLIRRLNLTMGV